MPSSSTPSTGLLSATANSDANRVATEDRDGFSVSGSVSSAAVLFSQDMLGYASISVQITSPGTGCTISYETSDDNTNWNLISGALSSSVGTVQAQTTSTSAQLIHFARRGRYFRARVSTYGSGTVSVVGTMGKHQGVIPGASFVTSIGAAIHGASITGAPVRIGARAINALYSTLSNGQVADLVATLVGALIQKPYSIPENDWSYAAAGSGIVNTTTAVTIAAAAGSVLRNYITAIDIMAEALGTATELAIRDGAGGTVLWRTKIGTGGQALTSINFPNPLKSSANTLLEVVTLTASGTGAVYFNAKGYIAP